LQKIEKYISEVASYTQGMRFDQFMDDAKTVSATAFVVGQMGELANISSLQTRETYPALPWKELRGMKNRIIHDYENIDLAMLWQTITEDFPVLAKQINALLIEAMTK
jgi:uncharacterized protein with HEPN domain